MTYPATRPLSPSVIACLYPWKPLSPGKKLILHKEVETQESARKVGLSMSRSSESPSTHSTTLRQEKTLTSHAWQRGVNFWRPLSVLMCICAVDPRRHRSTQTCAPGPRSAWLHPALPGRRSQTQPARVLYESNSQFLHSVPVWHGNDAMRVGTVRCNDAASLAC